MDKLQDGHPHGILQRRLIIPLLPAFRRLLPQARASLFYLGANCMDATIPSWKEVVSSILFISCYLDIDNSKHFIYQKNRVTFLKNLYH